MAAENNLGDPKKLARVPLTCAVCGGDTASDGGGVLTMSVRNVEGKLDFQQIRYHRACVPSDDRQVHGNHQELVDKAIAARGGAAPEPERHDVAKQRAIKRMAREVVTKARAAGERAPAVVERIVPATGEVVLVTPPGAALYKLVAEFEPQRGFSTVVYNELHAMMGVDQPISAATITQRILNNGEYHRTAPKAATAKDPTKPVSVTLEKWVAEGKAVRA